MSGSLNRLGPMPDARRSGPQIGPEGDGFEREANRAAEAIMAPGPRTGVSISASPAGTIQNKPAGAQHAAAAPQAAQAVAGGGRALSRGERSFFEPRFGRDLGAVRVHEDARAGAAAQAVGARAFALDNHIAFAPGQYDRTSGRGQHLMAHELTHTLQQGGVIRRDGPEAREMPLAQRMPESDDEQPATPAQRREFARLAAEFIQNQGEFFLLQQNRDLATALDLLRPATENALRAIENDNAQAEEEAVRRAYRNAVDALIVRRSHPPETGRTQAETRLRLYAQNRTHILPFALPETTAVAGSTELLDDLNEPLPDNPTQADRNRHRAIQAARRNMRVETASVTLTNWQSAFNPSGSNPAQALPANHTIHFAGNVWANLQAGLQTVATMMLGSILNGNETIMILLDLTPFGGLRSTYRFTRVDLGRQGTEVWVERVSDVFRDGLLDTQREEMLARFNGFGFTRAGFSTSEFDEVLVGLSSIPDHHLSSLGALAFQRSAISATNPGFSAEYNSGTHQVDVYDRAYASSMTRIGNAAVSGAAFAVTHEVGHALDMLPLRTQMTAIGQTEATLMREFGVGGNRFEGPRDPQHEDFERFNELTGELRQRRQDTAAARSRSGARINNPSGTRSIIDGAGNSDFRRAVVADGGNSGSGTGFPTTYPSPASYWQEYFAEAFALYQTSPEVLREMRPNVFAFFQREFPTTPPNQGNAP